MKTKFTILSFILILFLLPQLVKSFYFFHTLNVTLIYILAACSLRTIAVSGQISIAHAAIMGLGAYVSGIFAKEFGWSPWFTIPLGAIGGMISGALIGYPLVRVRAIYFSMVSLFCGMAIVALIGVFQNYTGGDAGLIGIPPLTPISIKGMAPIVFVTSKVNYYYFLLVLNILSLFALYRIERCRTGMCFKAIAQSHMVAASVGINEASFRVLALAVGSFFAGLAGGCYAHYNMTLTSTTFGFLPSINLLIYVLVGGTAHFAGPIIGTAVLIIVPEIFRWLKEYTPFVFGGIMLLVAYFMPQGIAGLFMDLVHRVRTGTMERRGRDAL